jgi:hypothetical protein
VQLIFDRTACSAKCNILLRRLDALSAEFCTTNMFESHAKRRKMSMPLVLLFFNSLPLTQSQNNNFDAASILQSEYEGNLPKSFELID